LTPAIAKSCHAIKAGQHCFKWCYSALAGEPSRIIIIVVMRIIIDPNRVAETFSKFSSNPSFQ
jgi:hypothetical protein